MTRLRGADPDTVRAAIDAGDPLPGARTFAPQSGGPRGFAGALDGRLVRDVLGRQPLFVERGTARDDAGTDGDRWAFDRTALEDPVAVPAGTVGGDRVWELPDPAPADDREAAVAALADAVDAAAPDLDGPAAVAFSGGVDSALAATMVDGPLYVAGFPDSDDVAAAREAAASLGRDLRVVELDHDDLRRTVPEIAAATGRTNAMDVEIALPLYAVAQRAAADGYDHLVVGQGADELFGGYAKVANAPDDERVAADTVRGATREVIRTLPEQLPRDVLAVRSAGVEPVAPFLDDRVVASALRLPGDLLVEGDRRKVALRTVAREYLPADIADRDKKAVQYGSDVAKELDRLARRNGYKRRMDDHVTKYVESLVDGPDGG